MSIFTKIWNKLNDPWGIQERKRLENERAATPATKAAPTSSHIPAQAPPAQGVTTSTTPPSAASPVDVEAVLSDFAAKRGGGGNWRTSIVDLLKLLELDSSLAARKELAEELGVHAGEHGSAEQNMALQKALLRRLAENGGKVPQDLID